MFLFQENYPIQKRQNRIKTQFENQEENLKNKKWYKKLRWKKW